MMEPPGAPLLDSACYIPPLPEVQDMARETVRLVEYGAYLQHELCWAAKQLLTILQPEEIFKQTCTPRTHWHETFVAPRQPATKYTTTKYI